MALYHCHIQSIGRNVASAKGAPPKTNKPNRSAVACAAYRAGCSLTEQVIDPDTGVLFERVHDYTKKDGVIFSAIFAPENSASWMKDREQLWNKIQLEFEKSCNSDFAKEFDIALPRELDIEQNLELLTEFVEEVLVSQGLVVDVNFHNDNPKNPHFHLMTSTRKIVPVLDASGAPTSEHTFGKKIRDIDHKSFLNHVRGSWASYANKHLERAGFHDRIDHRSYKDMGIDIVPTMHEGVGSHAKVSERAALNLEIIKDRAAGLIEKPETIIQLVGIEKSCFKLSDIEDKAGKFLLDNLGELDLGSEVKNRDNNVLNKDTQKINIASPEAVILDEHGVESLSKSKQEIMSQLLLSDNLVLLKGLSELGDYYTTRERIQREERFLDVAERLSRSGSSDVNNKLSRALSDTEISFLSSQDPINGLIKSAQQQSAVRGLVESGNLAQLYGYAGSGKSTVLTSVRDLYLGRGVNVTGLAPTAKSKGVLTDLGIEAETIHGLRAKEEGAAKTLARIKSGNIAGIEPWKLSAARNYKTPFTKDAVFMLDEASMVDLDMYSWILDKCDKGGSKLISIGDYNQLPVVKGIGGGFKALCSDDRFSGTTHTLSEIWRQKDKDYRDVTVSLANFKVSDALSILKEKKLDDLHLIEGGDSAVENRIVSDYVSWYKEQDKLRDVKREEMLSTNLGSLKYEAGSFLGFSMDGGSVDGAKSGVIISYKRQDVERLNHLVRKDLYLSGVLERSGSSLMKNISLSNGVGIDLNAAGTKVSRGESEISLLLGEQIMFLKNDKRAGLYNGEVATILKIQCGDFYDKTEYSKLNITDKVKHIFKRNDSVVQSHDILVRIHGSDGKDRIQWFNSAKYGSFDYGYASTLHKVQGSSYENVFFRFDKQVGFESFYVGMTRHKRNLNVYFDKDELKSILYERYGASADKGNDGVNVSTNINENNNDNVSRLSDIRGVGDTDKERDLNLSFAALESRVTRRSSELLISDLGDDKNTGDVSYKNTEIFAKYHQARNDYAEMFREMESDIAKNPKIGEMWDHPKWSRFKELKAERGEFAKVIAGDPASFEGELFVTKANLSVIREHAGITKFGIEREFGGKSDIASKLSNYAAGDINLDVRDKFKINIPTLKSYNDICDMHTSAMFGSDICGEEDSETKALSLEERGVLLANLQSDARDLYYEQDDYRDQIYNLREKKAKMHAADNSLVKGLEAQRSILSNISDGISKIYTSSPESVVESFEEYLESNALNARDLINRVDNVDLSNFGEVRGKSYNLGLFSISGSDKRRNLKDREFVVRSILNYRIAAAEVSKYERWAKERLEEMPEFDKECNKQIIELESKYLGEGVLDHLQEIKKPSDNNNLSKWLGSKQAVGMLERGYKMIRDKSDFGGGDNGVGNKSNIATRKDRWNDLKEMKSLLLSKLGARELADYIRSVIEQSSEFTGKNIEISSGNLKAGSLSVALCGASSGKWYRFSRSKGGDIYGLASYLGVSSTADVLHSAGSVDASTNKLNARETKQIRAYIEFSEVADYFGLDIGSELIASMKESGSSNLKNLNVEEIKDRISSLALSHVDIKSLDRSYISEYKDNWEALSKIPSDVESFNPSRDVEFLLEPSSNDKMDYYYKARNQVYNYRDTKGNLLCHTLRIEGRDGSRVGELRNPPQPTKKGVYPISYAKNIETGEVRWRVKVPSISSSNGTKPIYGLEKLGDIESNTKYSREYQGKAILIVEGEKTADAAQKIVGSDYAVISWMGGSSASNKVDWSVLEGRDVHIWGDNDIAGRKAVNKIIESVEKNSINVHSLNVVPVNQFGLSLGWDLADKLPDHLVSDVSDSNNIIKELIKNPSTAIAKSQQLTNLKIGAIGSSSKLMNNHNLSLLESASESDKIRTLGREVKAHLQKSGVWNNEYKARLNNELSIIEKVGSSSEFIRSANIIRYAKTQKIEVGEGRGSVVSSLTAYGLGIHTIDPIKHELSFDRFMSEGKTTVPDIDIDVSSKGREKLVDHVMSYYGDRATIMTTKSGARHPSGIMIMPENMNVEKISESGFGTFSFDDKTGYRLMHISDDVSNKDIENAGFRKIDLLSSKMIDQTRDVIDKVNKEHVSDIVSSDVTTAAMYDKSTYELIARGDTDGVFQLGSEGAKDICSRVHPKEFSDVVNILALNRPGARKWLPLFEDNNNQDIDPDQISKATAKETETVEVPHDPVGIFASTRGAVLYQEQIMEAGVKYFGIERGDSDSFRRDLEKSDLSKRVLANKEKCIEYAISNKSRSDIESSMTKSQAEHLYNTLEKASSFVYNKSHAVAYAKHTLTTAYLKEHYRDVFVETHDLQDKEKNQEKEKIIDNNKIKKEIYKDLKKAIEIRFDISGIRNFKYKSSLSYGLSTDIITESKLDESMSRCDGGDIKNFVLSDAYNTAFGVAMDNDGKLTNNERLQEKLSRSVDVAVKTKESEKELMDDLYHNKITKDGNLEENPYHLDGNERLKLETDVIRLSNMFGYNKSIKKNDLNMDDKKNIYKEYALMEDKIEHVFKHNKMVREFAKDHGENSAKYLAGNMVDYQLSCNNDQQKITGRKLDIMKHVANQQHLMELQMRKVIEGDKNVGYRHKMISPELHAKDCDELIKSTTYRLGQNMRLEIAARGVENLDVASAQKMRNETIVKSFDDLYRIQKACILDQTVSLEREKEHEVNKEPDHDKSSDFDRGRGRGGIEM